MSSDTRIDEGRPPLSTRAPHSTQHSDIRQGPSGDFETLLRSRLKEHEEQLASHRRLVDQQSISRLTNSTTISGKGDRYSILSNTAVVSSMGSDAAGQLTLSSSSRIGGLLNGMKKSVSNHQPEESSTPNVFQHTLAMLRSNRNSSAPIAAPDRSNNKDSEKEDTEDTNVHPLMSKPSDNTIAVEIDSRIDTIKKSNFQTDDERAVNSVPQTAAFGFDTTSYEPRKTEVQPLMSNPSDNTISVEIDSRIDTIKKSNFQTDDEMLGNSVPQTASRGSDTASQESHNTVLLCTGTPIISSVSRKLAIRSRQESGVYGLDIGTSLLIRADQARADKWLKQKQMNLEEVPGRPNVSSRAKSARNRGNDNSICNRTSSRSRYSANERLYELSKTEQKKKNLMSVTAELKALIETNIDSFRPTITSRARVIKRKENHTCHGDLYTQAVECKKQREEEEMQRMRELDAYRRAQTPMVNPISRLIAANLGVTTMERLCEKKLHSNSTNGGRSTPRTSIIPMTYDADGHIVPTPYAAKQRLNDGMNDGGDPSSRVGQSKTYNSDRIKELHDEHARRMSRRIALNEKANATLPKECTFKPHLSTISRQMTASYNKVPQKRSVSAAGADDRQLCVPEGYSHSSEVMPYPSIAERSELWTMRRENRLAKERLETQRGQLKECTFEPTINPPLQGNPFFVTPTEDIPGCTGFLDRQRNARYLAEEKQHIEELVASGIGWGTHPPLYNGRYSVSVEQNYESQDVSPHQPNVVLGSSNNIGTCSSSKDRSISQPIHTHSEGRVTRETEETDVLQRAIQALNRAKYATSRSELNS